LFIPEVCGKHQVMFRQRAAPLMWNARLGCLSRINPRPDATMMVQSNESVWRRESLLNKGALDSLPPG